MSSCSCFNGNASFHELLEIELIRLCVGCVWVLTLVCRYEFWVLVHSQINKNLTKAY